MSKSIKRTSPYIYIIVVVAALLVAVVLQQFNSGHRWHEGPNWRRFLNIMDGMVSEQFRSCQSKQVESRFGSTRVYACGNPSHPPVVFLHASATCSLMYSEWILPKLSGRFYAVAVDTLCDIGRSYPRDGNPVNCPKTGEDIAEWIADLGDQLRFQQPTSIVGYSYGSFLASQVALANPDQVDKVVMLSPAAVFAPISPRWMARAMFFGIFSKLLPTDEMRKRLSNWFYGSMMVDKASIQSTWNEEQQELLDATDRLFMAQHGLYPTALSDDALKELASKHPTLLVIGQEESVLDAAKAVERAKQAGAKIKVYPNSGHMLLVEYPRDEVEGLVTAFLDGNNIEKENASS